MEALVLPSLLLKIYESSNGGLRHELFSEKRKSLKLKISDYKYFLASLKSPLS